MKRRDGMKRDEHVNDIPDIEIVDLENETVQDTDFGKSDISDDFEGNPDDEYEENDREKEEEEHPAPKGIRRFLNLHVLFALVLLVVVGLLGYRITHWGQRVSQSVRNTTFPHAVRPAAPTTEAVLHHLQSSHNQLPHGN